jgi:hypothetical protein
MSLCYLGWKNVKRWNRKRGKCEGKRGQDRGKRGHLGWGLVWDSGDWVKYNYSNRARVKKINKKGQK